MINLTRILLGLFKIFMKNNYSKYKTQTPSENWIKMNKDERFKTLKKIIDSDIRYKNFEIFNTPDNGQLVFKIDENISVNERGLMLLNFEKKIKASIDKGLTVWCEPVGDKSKLRNLRGIKLNYKNNK
jgi:hypothetical protein